MSNDVESLNVKATIFILVRSDALEEDIKAEAWGIIEVEAELSVLAVSRRIANWPTSPTKNDTEDPPVLDVLYYIGIS